VLSLLKAKIFFYELLWKAEQTQIEFVQLEKHLIGEKIAFTSAEMTL